MNSKRLMQWLDNSPVAARDCLAACLLLSVASPAAAFDASFSGFATVGYAVSDQDQPYLRYIDKSGSWKTDSLIGAQLDMSLDPRWGVTLQGVARAPKDKDEGIAADLSWAFLSFRPTNDWLVRAGKLRSPYFIHAMNAEVGITYDQARLPAEFYSTSASSYDYLGATVAKTWLLRDGEMTLDLFYANEFAANKARIFFRSTGEPAWFDIKVRGEGAVLSYSQDGLLLRGSYAHLSGDDYATLEPMAVSGGGTIYLPGAQTKKLDVDIAILGLDWHREAWRITTEYAVTALSGSYGGSSGYVTVARHIGSWTPYVTYSITDSNQDTKQLYKDLNNTPVPAVLQLPPYNLSASYHQDLADSLGIVDQWSAALGAAYQLSPTTKIKAEWAHTTVGLTSALFDGGLSGKTANIYTVTYAVVF